MKARYFIFLAILLASGGRAQVSFTPALVIEEVLYDFVEPPVIVTKLAVQSRDETPLSGEGIGIDTFGLRQEPVATASPVEKLAARVYMADRKVVIVKGQKRSYLTTPVLFEEGTAELLDGHSQLAIRNMASWIEAVLAENPSAVFDVEGHTSTDGPEELNLKLSAERARRVCAELVDRYGLPASSLAARGFGERYSMYPDGTDGEMILDRRVLLVRVK